jgi:hypothetical protein
MDDLFEKLEAEVRKVQLGGLVGGDQSADCAQSAA